MSKTEVILLDLKESPFATRVRIALAEKGVRFESFQQDLLKKSEILLQSNPIYKKIPVLLHADRPPLAESLVILNYVDEEWPNPPLLPSDAHKRATARFWADFVDRMLFPALNKILNSKGAGEELESAKEETIEALNKLEEFLGDKDFFLGDNFGFVDVAFIPFTTWIYGLGKIAGFDVNFPKIILWIERCMQRETVAKEMPSREDVCGFICKMRQILGLD